MTVEEARLEMQELGLSQVQLSELCGVPRSTIWAWFSGKYVPSLDAWEKVVAALDAVNNRTGVANAVRVILERMPDAQIRSAQGKFSIAFEGVKPGSAFAKFLQDISRARRFLNSEGLDKAMYDDIVAGLIRRYKED